MVDVNKCKLKCGDRVIRNGYPDKKLHITDVRATQISPRGPKDGLPKYRYTIKVLSIDAVTDEGIWYPVEWFVKDKEYYRDKRLEQLLDGED